MPSISWPSFIAEWGSTRAERAQRFACDRYLPEPELTLFRAVDVEAPAATTFRWLCQLRAAPYSYDRLDNLGRRSPQQLTPGLERLQIGQRVQTIFRLVEFEPGRSLTMTSNTRAFGRVAVTYRADPVAEGRSRIVVKLLCRLGGGIQRPLMRVVAAPGDLVMMRRQLLNLKELAEGSAAAAASREG